MANPRVRKVADRIQVIVAEMLERRIKDPRLGFVTVTDVRVSGDTQQASVFYTVLGEEEQVAASAAALESAKGLIRSEVAKQLGMRHAPTLEFIHDALPGHGPAPRGAAGQGPGVRRRRRRGVGRVRRTPARPTRTASRTRPTTRRARRASTRLRRRVSDQAPAGLVVVDKPAGMTSHDVVARIRRLAGTRKVGHAGTLDPMATGVLLVGVNRATRLLGHLTLTEKAYDATVRLGAATTTDDAEGETLSTASVAHLTEDDVRSRRGCVRRRPRAEAVGRLRDQGRRQACLRAGPCRRGRRPPGPPGHRPRAAGHRRPRRARTPSTWTCRCAAAAAPTSGRSPATSAPPSASAGTSPRCAAPRSGRSRSPRRTTSTRWPTSFGWSASTDVARRCFARTTSTRSRPATWATAASSRGRARGAGTGGGVRARRPVPRALRAARARWPPPRRGLRLTAAVDSRCRPRADLALPRRGARRPRADRRHGRQLRRRAPRPPARRTPGARGRADAGRPARRGGDLRPAPDGGAAARARPADPHRRGDPGPRCSGRPASTPCSSLPFTREVAAWTPERFVERHPRRRAARPGGRRRRQLPLRREGVRRRRDAGRAGPRRTTSPPRASRSTAARRSGRRRTSAAACSPATSRAPRRRSATRSPCAARWSRATSAAASSATRPPTCRPRACSPRPPTACTPAGCAGSTDAGRRSRAAPGRDQRRHQPDLRGRARAPRRGLRAGPRRPRAVRRRGRGVLRRPDPRHAPLRLRRGARRDDGPGRRAHPERARRHRSMSVPTEARRAGPARRGAVVPAARPALLRRVRAGDRQARPEPRPGCCRCSAVGAAASAPPPASGPGLLADAVAADSRSGLLAAGVRARGLRRAPRCGCGSSPAGRVGRTLAQPRACCSRW